MKKRKVAKKTKTIRTGTRRTGHQPKLIYGLEQEFVLIFGGGFAVVVLGIFLLFSR